MQIILLFYNKSKLISRIEFEKIVYKLNIQFFAKGFNDNSNRNKMFDKYNVLKRERKKKRIDLIDNIKIDFFSFDDKIIFDL